jgi:phosphatidate cytidylyltransferase
VLKQRVITAVVSIPIVVAAIWFGTPWFTILIVICGVLGSLEFYGMVFPKRVSYPVIFGTVWSVLFIINPHFNSPLITQSLFASAVIVPLASTLFQKQKEGAFIGWAWTISGILYIGWLLSHLVSMRYLDNGRDWIFLALFANLACDTTAFFVGRAMGKTKLAPSISPKKTWEGAIGGFLAAIAGSFILSPFLNLPIGYGGVAIVGVLVGIFGQLGDLVESVLKRNAGVKDAGKLLPGHGGMMDRLDSIAFIGAVIYYYVVWGIR